MTDGMVCIVDFGGQDSRLLARRVRGCRVYCEILPARVTAEQISALAPKGLIFAGTPEEEMPAFDRRIAGLGIPILAIGATARLLCEANGGQLLETVHTAHTPTVVRFDESPLFAGLTASERLFESYDRLDLSGAMQVIARTDEGVPVAFAVKGMRMYGMQFGIEQNDPDGLRILQNFCVSVSGAKDDWTMETYRDAMLREIRAAVGGKRVVMAISGGVDSAVTAALMYRAIGEKLCCLHINTGLLRKGEEAFVSRVFRSELGIHLKSVDASESIYAALSGASSLEDKRRQVEGVLTQVFCDQVRALGDVGCVALGTIYNDILDGAVSNLATEFPDMLVLEPVKRLFKAEVRELGSLLGLPDEMVRRPSFPGSGFAVRCFGAVTREKIALLREADDIFREEIVAAGQEKRIDQFYAVLYGGTDGYSDIIALCALNHIGNGQWMPCRLPYDLQEKVVSRILSEVRGVRHVLYNISADML